MSQPSPVSTMGPALGLAGHLWEGASLMFSPLLLCCWGEVLLMSFTVLSFYNMYYNFIIWTFTPASKFPAKG